MSDPDGDSISTGKLVWNVSIESMLAKWCDEAKCFEWMHTESYRFNEKKARIIMIASNVLTAVSGLSNVIAGGYTINGFQLAWAFGALSITVSITNMLQEKLAYATRASQHNTFSIQWGSIRRRIEEELLIPPESRKDCKTFLKYLRQDINQVSIAGNSMISNPVKEKCFQKFNTIHEFGIPDICGQMEHTQIYVKPAGSHSEINTPSTQVRFPEVPSDKKEDTS